jgi:hypothetical protein
MGITQNIGASSLIKPGVIDNTAARPASPYEGQVIFQKDTDQLLVWNGTTWVIPNSPAQNPQGLEFITGGTQSGSTALNVDGCFTTTYNNYRIVLSEIQISTSDRALRLNYRSSGTTNTNGDYIYAYRGLRENGVSGDTSSGGSVAFAEIGVYIATFANLQLGNASIDIYSPNLSVRTGATVNAYGYESGYQFRQGGFVFNVNTPFDGFRIFLNSTGNVAFKYEVYGYRK